MDNCNFRVLVVLTVLVIGACCSLQGETATVIEASPCKVLVVTNDDGTTTVIRPTSGDYAFCLETQKEVTKTIPVARRLFGKKCHKKG